MADGCLYEKKPDKQPNISMLGLKTRNFLLKSKKNTKILSIILKQQKNDLMENADALFDNKNSRIFAIRPHPISGQISVIQHLD